MNKEQLIAQYFTKKLSQKAQKEFNHFMVNDKAFAKEVTFQENLKKVIDKEERDSVKLQLQDFELEEKSPFNYKKWLVASSIIVLLAASSFWYFNKPINTEKLYTEHFEPYRNIVHPIVRGDVNTDLKAKAFIAYESKTYQEALNLFNTLLKEKDDETLAFYKANILLKLNKTEEAASIFKGNLKTSDSLDAKNNWYLALAYLKLNDIESAKTILNELNTTSSFKNKGVKQLLKQLN